MSTDTTLTAMEQAIIGAVLDPSRRGILDDLNLSPEDFNDVRCEAVYHKAQRLSQAGQTFDAATMAAAVDEDPEFDVKGVDFGWLYNCFTANTTLPLVLQYAGKVRDEATRRRLRTVARRITQAADEGRPVDDLVDMARREVDAAGRVDVSGLVTLGESMRDTLRAMNEPTRRVATPWSDVNDLIGGFRPGGMYVVGARPAVGKSVVALQCALSLAKEGYVSFSSLEMGRDEINQRIMAHDLEIDLKKISDNTLSQAEWERINDHMPFWDASKLMVNDSSAVSFANLRHHARSVARRGELSGVVVDYLQLMQGDKSGGRDPKRQEVVAELSRNLKMLARELQVPVIALSQLNRESTNSEDKMPRISQLRESGAVEQDADVVILLHRELDGPNKYDMQMLVAKNRQGRTGVVDMDFYGQYSKAVCK
jgi:replicative DNA helicase